MEKLSPKSYPLVRQESDNKKIILPGYPTHPAGEDIYEQCKEETEIDPEDTSDTKDIEVLGVNNQKDFDEDVSGADLDVPGAEQDDNQPGGGEDEENNLYSLGGENHHNLDENNAPN